LHRLAEHVSGSPNWSQHQNLQQTAMKYKLIMWTFIQLAILKVSLVFYVI